jgi:hypothetical protein
MCIGKGAKVAGMEGSDKCFETFVNPGRVKLASWRNCRPQKFSVQDVYHGIVDDTKVLGARFIIAPTRGPTAIKLAKYGIVDHKSFGCKMYITEHGE